MAINTVLLIVAAIACAGSIFFLTKLMGLEPLDTATSRRFRKLGIGAIICICICLLSLFAIIGADLWKESNGFGS